MDENPSSKKAVGAAMLAVGGLMLGAMPLDVPWNVRFAIYFVFCELLAGFLLWLAWPWVSGFWGGLLKSRHKAGRVALVVLYLTAVGGILVPTLKAIVPEDKDPSRPWIHLSGAILDARAENPSKLLYSLTNVGRSPATLLWADGKLGIAANRDELEAVLEELRRTRRHAVGDVLPHGSPPSLKEVGEADLPDATLQDFVEFGERLIADGKILYGAAVVRYRDNDGREYWTEAYSIYDIEQHSFNDRPNHMMMK